jgi:hypothetical protein
LLFGSETIHAREQTDHQQTGKKKDSGGNDKEKNERDHHAA